jgi:SAM-dependent methyltransferase
MRAFRTVLAAMRQRMERNDLDRERKQAERRFHDERFEHDVRGAVDKFYAVTEASVTHLREAVRSRCAGKHLLECGCGPKPHALALAPYAASVTGIDISGVAARRATEEAERAGVGNARFLVMDAEQMDFSDDSFDVVFGSSILHHLDLERSLAEIARVARAGGTAIFLEPMGHNPAVNAYRRLTPHLRTRDEHPLTLADLERAKRSFAGAEYTFYHLLSLLAVPLRRTRPFRPVVRALDAADRALFERFPPIQRLAWFVLMVLEASPRHLECEPRKCTASETRD